MKIKMQGNGSSVEVADSAFGAEFNEPLVHQVVTAFLAGSDPAAFAQGLQKAGYATDPAYASKLTRVITSSIMRQGLSA